MGLIRIEDMEFYAFHGHYREEQIVGSHFMVDVTMETDTGKAGKSDDLNDTVNYQTAYLIVKREMEKTSNLLEHIATRIMDALYTEMEGILKATVKVSKLNPVMGGRIGRVSLEISR
ncbi:MAG: dihydroneopterin aldolase [Bacteroidales bacterium]|jgi:dihydroneopterin aldolase|nr:dihydroneopterin aldolase [Bacteroidales bacterium]